MQLYALDSNGNPIFADEAHRQQDYSCMECSNPVRMRGGSYRRNHYYHIGQVERCSLHSKSIEHIQVQCFIKDKLKNKVALEHRFPAINRIADVVWFEEKIIFEVQCSPITAAEVASRNGDYASCGFQVIWVLHDMTFNKNKFTAAEHYLRQHPHYYTNIASNGEGMLYDQYSTFSKGYRKLRTKSFPLALQVKREKTFRRWPCYLEGGLKEWKSDKEAKPTLLERLKRHYSGLIQLWLESACR